MKTFTALCAFLSHWCMRLGIGGLILLIAAVTWQVFGRYVLNSTPTWAESLSLVLVLYVTMLGTAVAVRDAAHIGLESFLVLAPQAVRLVMEYLIHTLVFTFGVVMCWQCAVLMHSVWPYKLPTLPISEGMRYLPAIIAGVLIALFSVENILKLANPQLEKSVENAQ